MGLLWMILLVVLVSAEAQNVTEVEGLLGKDVMLNCSIRDSDVHWYMESHNQLNWCIGRSYSGEPSYCSPGLQTKYLILKNTLVIKTVTAEDRRLYFCGRKINGSIRFVDTFRLISGFPDVPPSPSDCRTQNHLVLVYRSALIVTVLVFLIIGLVGVSSYLKSTKRLRQVDEPPGETYENSEPLQMIQVEEINSQPARRR